MIRMKATKPLTYRTRRLLADGTSEATSSLQPGDIFEAIKGRDVRLLLATRKAEMVREPANVPAPPPAVAEKIAAAVAPAPAPASAVGTITAAPSSTTAAQAAPDDRPALRAEYEQKLGKAPFPGWSSDQLREKIAAAKEAS